MYQWACYDILKVRYTAHMLPQFAFSTPLGESVFSYHCCTEHMVKNHSEIARVR